MMKKLTMTAAAVVFAIGTLMLTACGGSDEAQITDATSLAAANKTAQEAAENFHMDMDMDMDMTIKMDGLEEVMGTDSLTMPLKMTMSMDSGKETAHGDSNTSMTMMGESMEQASEMYIDMVNKATYTKAEGTDQWVKTENDASMSDMMSSASELGADLLSKAAFAETEDGYTLTLDAKEMGDAVKDMNLFGNYSAAGMEFKEFSINSGEIVYTFYKDTALLKKIEMKALDVKAKGDMSGTEIDMQVPINATLDYNKYGELSPSDYEIPAEVTAGE